MYEGIKPIEPYLGNPEYTLNTDLANYNIKYIEKHTALSPDKPWFVYYAPGAWRRVERSAPSVCYVMPLPVPVLTRAKRTSPPLHTHTRTTGATHAPHHVPKEWIDKFAGQFDQGWDKQREMTFAKQKELGIFPEDAKLTERPKEIPAWDETPEDERKVYARFMEVRWLMAGLIERFIDWVIRCLVG